MNRNTRIIPSENVGVWIKQKRFFFIWWTVAVGKKFILEAS